MTTCGNFTDTHDGRDPMPVRFQVRGMGADGAVERPLIVLCAGCRSHPQFLGAEVIERRAVERRAAA